MRIDIAIPTYKGEEPIKKCLFNLYNSIANSRVGINRIIVDYRPDNDNTVKIITNFCNEKSIDLLIYEGQRNLPESRQFLLDKIDTSWFLFLDDDVMLERETISRLCNSISPNTGAVQVRKRRQKESNSKYVKNRSQRGTLFATLIRKEAVDGIDIPSVCTVLEDEYIRQYVEDNGYLWTFDHSAYIKHLNQGRHGIDYTEGYLAGKYRLLEYDYVLLHPFYAVLTRQNPIPHTQRAFGYLRGLLC